MSPSQTSGPGRYHSPADKPLDQMNRLGDMLHFSAAVNAGATANILLTVAATYLLVGHYGQVFAPALWIALVLALNLLPVVLLRSTTRAGTPTRTLRTMNFFTDQHRFSDWVYLAASANMAFWILAAWSLFSVLHTPAALVTALLVAFLATFSPVLARAAGILRS